MEPFSDDIFYIENLYTENARLLASEISNDTALMILKELYKNPSSLSDLSNRLNIPISTTQYHIDKLLELGVVKIAKRRLGKRLRDIKMYVYDKESIIFSSIEKNDFNSLLKTFTFFRIREKAPIIAIVIFGAGLVLSLFGSWLLKNEIESVYTPRSGDIGGGAIDIIGKIEMSTLLVFIGTFFFIGSAISIILLLLAIRKK